MNEKRVIPVVLLTLLALLAQPLRGSAGVEPSPFQPQINQLGAVANILNAADFRVAKTLSHPPDPCVPPDPCEPGPDLNGVVNKLNAIDRQIMSADDMVFSMIEEVMGFDPTPFRTDLIPALEIVGDAAQGISDKVSTFIETQREGLPVDFIDALWYVGNSALSMVETVSNSIEQLQSGSGCSLYENQEDCVQGSSCVWVVPDSGAPPYCMELGY